MSEKINENIKAVAGLVPLGTFVIYCLGFVTLSTYYSTFSLSATDILSSRFLTTGIVLSLFLSLCFILGTNLSKIYPIEKALFKDNSLGKLFIALSLIVGSLTSSYIVKIVCNQFGRQAIGGSFRTFYKGLPFFEIINKLPLKEDLKLLLFIFILVSLILLIYFLFQVHITKSKKTTEQSSGEAQVPFLKNVLLDFACYGSVLTLLIYSIIKLSIFTVDLDNLGDYLRLEQQIIFSWFYISTLAIYLLHSEVFSFKKILEQRATPFEYVVFVVSELTCIMLLILPIYFFAKTIYPRLPASLGGGEPQFAYIHLKNKPVTESYVLGEDNDELFIVYKTETETKVERVKKENVESIEVRRILNTLLHPPN